MKLVVLQQSVRWQNVSDGFTSIVRRPINLLLHLKENGMRLDTHVMSIGTLYIYTYHTT